MARVELVIRAGSADDPAGRMGLAELVGEYLREGSRFRDADSLAREVAELGVVGGEIGVEVGPYETAVRSDVLAESVPALVLVLGDIVQHPALAPEVLARLQANQVRRFAMRRSQAATVAAARVNALIFPNHPADRTAPAEDVQALTLADVRRFHAAHFVASRAHLYVAGSSTRPPSKGPHAKPSVHGRPGRRRCPWLWLGQQPGRPARETH